MANIINLITSGAGGLSTSADSSGILNIQSAGTTVAAIASTGMAVTGTSSVSGDLSFNSGFGSAAVAYGCRAWVAFNGQGTVAILGSGNVSSITDNGVGDYRINMTTAMPDGNYCVVSNAVASGSVDFQAPIKAFVNTSTFDIYTSNGTALTDPPGVFVTVFR
jgi:hypothetical protein